MKNKVILSGIFLCMLSLNAFAAFTSTKRLPSSIGSYRMVLGTLDSTAATSGAIRTGLTQVLYFQFSPTASVTPTPNRYFTFSSRSGIVTCNAMVSGDAGAWSAIGQ